MAPQISSDRSSKTGGGHCEKISESPGPYDALFHAICPQHPGKPRLDGPPRIPPTTATRKHTPVRPVYDDFATAYSLITSGSTKGQSKVNPKSSPKKQRGLLGRGRPLPRRAHRSIKVQKKALQLNKAPIPPDPTKISQTRANSDFEFDVSEVNFTLTRSPKVNFSSSRSLALNSRKQLLSSPFFDSLKKAWVSRSSLVGKPARATFAPSFELPRDSMELTPLSRSQPQLTQELRDGHDDNLPPTESAKARRSDSNALRFVNDPSITRSNWAVSLFEAAIGNGTQLLSDGQDVQNNANLGGTTAHAYYYDAKIEPHPHRSDGVNCELMGPGSYFDSSIAPDFDFPETSLTQEGSTVNNIVKEYATNNGLWDVRLDSDDENSEDDSAYFQEAKPQNRGCDDLTGATPSGSEVGDEGGIQLEHLRRLSTAEVRKQNRAFKLTDSSGQAPSVALPQLPFGADQEAIQSSTERLGLSSSYGDTRSIIQRPQTVSPNGDPAGIHIGALPHSGEAFNCQNDIDHNPFRHSPPLNRFRPSFADAGSSLPSTALRNVAAQYLNSGNVEDLAIAPRLTLERDVSRALRHLSAFSSFSRNTSTQDRGDGGFQSSSDSGGLLSFIGKHDQPAQEAQNLGLESFYHESVIPKTWIGSQRYEQVRIPIYRYHNVSSSLPASHSSSSASDNFELLALNERDEDGNDWETVAESGICGRAVTNPHRLMVNVNRTGSSLANNSDNGNTSPKRYEHSHFSSTDRIIQHPAQIEYSHDYRYREIKEGTFPVLLPSYRQHTVNGFPANAYRSVSPFQPHPNSLSYRSPPPLASEHRNPFRSAPPEVMSDRRSMGNSLKPNCSVNGQVAELKRPKSSNSAVSEDSSRDWMYEFGDPGPVVKPGQEPFASTATATPIDPPPDLYSLSRTIGSSIADASSSTLSAITGGQAPLDGRPDANASTSIHTAAYVDGSQSLGHDCAPFVKCPPGAFYQGVRSGPDPGRKGLSLGRRSVHRLPTRSPSQSCPTNQMRPLSLLKAHRLEPPIETEGRSPGERKQIHNFLYRSPLAPIKSKSWRNLYTREQLSEIRDAAKSDGIYEIESLARQSSRPSSGEALKANSSWKRLPWTPHMFAWPRDNSSIKTDLANRKSNISNIILALCCLFPPMLILYGAGYLDSMMMWITGGEISTFGKAHKKLALQLVVLFIIAVLVAIPVIVHKDTSV